MAPAIPTTVDECTPEWLTEVLRSRRVISDDAVITDREVEILGAGQGFMCELARMTLVYGSGTGPATLVAKIPTQVPDNRKGGEIAGVYERELRVYEELLPNLDVEVPHPAVYYSDIEPNPKADKAMENIRRLDRLPIWLLRVVVWITSRFMKPPSFPSILLVEDLRPPLAIGDQVAGCDVEQAGDALDVVARLHAATWAGRAPAQNHWIVPFDLAPRLSRAVVLGGRRSFLAGFGHLLSPHARAVFAKGIDDIVPLIRRMGQTVPRCLLHGDYRLDNMFFDADNRVAAVIDWQTASLGPAVTDVAYFIAGSLDTSVPEAEVDALLERYHATLGRHGVSGYSLDQLKADYADMLSLMLTRMAGVDLLDFGAEDGRGAELVTEWIRRLDARVARVAA